MLRIELVKSPIGNNVRNRATVQALGLRKLHQVVIQPDNSSIRGMVHHVKHMLSVEVVEDAPKAAETQEAPKAERKPRAKKEKVADES